MKKILLGVAIAMGLTGCAGSNSNYAPVIDLSINLNSVLEVDRKGLHYVVRPGDTLSEIAIYHGASIKQIALINGMRYPYKIRVGQKILIAKHRSTTVQKASGKTYAKVVYKDDKAEEAKAVKAAVNHVGPTSKGWTTPAPNGSLTKKYTKNSKGIDMVTTDHYVYAAKSGTIEFSDSLRGYDNVVIVKHSQAYMSIYTGKFDYLVKVNERVKAGQKIAKYYDADSGNNKLHFEVRKGQVAIDPSKYALK